MGLDIGKFINKQTQSIQQQLTGSFSELDQALAASGSVVRKISALTGADALVGKGSGSFFEDAANLLKITPPERVIATQKSVEQTVATAANKVERLSYPSTLGDFRLTLEFMDYKRPTPLQEATVERQLFIHLPLPRELQTSQAIQTQTTEMGLFGTMFDVASTGEGTKGALAGAGAAAGLSKIVGLLRAASVAGPLQQSLEQIAGAALNPNLSVAFKGPSLREYSLSWQFAPHSALESRTIKAIIQQIQARSLPSMTFDKSTAVLSYPQMVQVSVNPKTTPYKKALITSHNIDYATNGIPTFFKGTNEPTFIQLTLNFLEIEYFLSEDFGGQTAKGISSQFSQVVENAPNAVGQIVSDTVEGGKSIVGLLTGAGAGAIADTSNDA